MTTEIKTFDGHLLAIDTSTSSMSIALARGGALIGEMSSQAERNHSIHLLPQIMELLNENGLHPRELDAFAVGVGPGSYTGVRIGVTVAKTFAWAHSMSLVAVSSLETMALGGLEAYLLHQGVRSAETGDARSLSALNTVCAQPETTTWIVPMIEARRGQAFTALYQAAGREWSCLVPDGIRLMSSWTEQLLAEAEKPDGKHPDRIIFTGETALHGEVLQRFFAAWGAGASEVPHEIRARHLAELGVLRLKQGLLAQPHTLVPNYTQLPEAEAKLLAHKS
ncbi:tRNA (adenosine(37)-N6)-threonylcarbamoyltransferase complex dimerization subunit type 1 TsaB [Paenibacillus doosanensis]|uniref:tRNA threonylcarbamoyladenosine biosynthesis protein TsaB n=1 Tax=Paenibacillus konkukensis TaxID=2020716 RepID=A0ABY4RTB3_9BACL|nr:MULTISPECIES: tRNA (adenosine(37)-N6)-threonylcarbamoyltransferase complex dimerization subunit type 1 TsaB [Paenibacillus]MCS7463241.1 tRNA (adenosine(37)-N6)-threonylcarbamoyltransferase complex dimerization subunit type 1 TsaB [Paenibacillus doosanensis]UQZ85225.1 tRNA threonylcarbamoyladenosine biosynthesis protein TsaB [Paenibacillus konkukensis]